ASVLGGIDLLHAVALERLDLMRCDRSAAAHDDTDVLGAALSQHVDHVAEAFVVSSLIGGHRNGVDVLLSGGVADVADAAVVAEMDDFRALRLQEPTNHVDGSIMAIEQ